MMRQYRDIYRGFEIDYSPDHEGYDIYLHGVRQAENLESFDSCCEWIDGYIKRNGLALGLRLFQC